MPETAKTETVKRSFTTSRGLADAAERAAVARHEGNFSRFVSEAIAAQLRREALEEFLAEFEPLDERAVAEKRAELVSRMAVSSS